MAERGRVKHLGRQAWRPPAEGEGVGADAKVHIQPRRITTLFVGSLDACNAAMRDRGVNPAELGRSWAIAYNGPQHFDHAVVDGLVEVIREPGHEPTDWEQATLEAVMSSNMRTAPTPF